MISRAPSLAAGLLLLLIPLNRSGAEELHQDPAQAPLAQDSLFRLGEMAQAAADLHKAGEAFARFAKSLDSFAESIGGSLATMSSEFDPFGYKTAFRTIGRQAEMLQAEREIIRALQQREIERLQSENRELRRKIEKLRQRKAKR
jgi:hypothetical protein